MAAAPGYHRLFRLPRKLGGAQASYVAAKIGVDDMKKMINLIARAGIEPEIGAVLPMERAEEAFRAMWEGKTHGKTVFTR
jgi:D-arabinose 1-dehydrogenase-like Zn-dependent alcohol dehydrogenase